jgi:hypothetical protein
MRVVEECRDDPTFQGLLMHWIQSAGENEVGAKCKN